MCLMPTNAMVEIRAQKMPFVLISKAHIGKYQPHEKVTPKCLYCEFGQVIWLVGMWRVVGRDKQ